MSIPATEVLEHVGSVMGVLGAVLLASNTKFSRFGWVGFMVSSVALTGFAYMIEAWSLLAMQFCFLATNGLGMYRWLIGPALQSRKLASSAQPTCPAS